MEPDSANEPGLKFRLLEVAVAMLAKPAPVKLPTMRDLATKAGVAPGAAYRHFASQDQLFMSVLVHLFANLERSMRIATEGVEQPRARIAALAHAYVSWGLQNAGGYQLMFESTDDEKLLEPGQRPGLHLIQIVAAEIAKQQTPPEPSLIKATQLWVSLHGIVSLRIHKLGMPWPNTVEQQVDELLRSHLDHCTCSGFIQNKSQR